MTFQINGVSIIYSTFNVGLFIQSLIHLEIHKNQIRNISE